MRQFLLVIALSIPLPGCVLAKQTENEPLHPDRVAKLVPGTSTGKEVVELLGAPTEVVQLGRRSAYRYEFLAKKETGLLLLVVNLFNSDARADRVWVFFDEHDVLTHVASSMHADQARYAMPWSSVHDK
jgi:hypothetical protein